MLHRILHMLIKEFLQLRRDRAAKYRLLIPPLVQMLVFGYAATFEVNRVYTAVLDYDHSQESRELISRFSGTGRFIVTETPENPAAVRDLIDRSAVTMALRINPQFAEKLRKGDSAPLQVIVDGTNSNTALIALGYVGVIVERFAADYSSDRMTAIAPDLAPFVPAIEMEERPWYNPDLNSQWFFVPGIVGSLVLMTIVNLTSFAIVREREMGTLEQVMVTPIRPVEFILGKTVPFFIIGVLEVLLVALAGTLWFEVPFRGSIAVMLLGTSLFLMSTLAVGLLISTNCSTQQQAFASSFFFLTPAFTLSGFAFPIASMPVVLQWTTYINPLRYYLVVLRGVFLKGTGMAILWPQMAAMAAIATVLLAICTLRFRKSLD